MRGFFKVLELIARYMGIEYSAYYADVKVQLYKLFDKYVQKFGVARSQRVAQPSGIQVSQSKHGEGSLVVLDQMLLVPLALTLHLYLLLVFLSYLLI
jgi:hypothetical protein